MVALTNMIHKVCLKSPGTDVGAAGFALRLSDRREGAREIRLYQDEVYTTLINFSYYLPKFQEGIKSYEHF